MSILTSSFCAACFARVAESVTTHKRVEQASRVNAQAPLFFCYSKTVPNTATTVLYKIVKPQYNISQELTNWCSAGTREDPVVQRSEGLNPSHQVVRTRRAEADGEIVCFANRSSMMMFSGVRRRTRRMVRSGKFFESATRAKCQVTFDGGPTKHIVKKLVSSQKSYRSTSYILCFWCRALTV